MRKRLIGIGLAIILLTNVMVLGNVFYNRSGLPDSQLTLSEREFSQPWRGQSKEDSSLMLALNWRVAPPPAEKPRHSRYIARGSTAWLDQQKMQALGFTLPSNVMQRPIAEKEVIFVLELNGAAYQQSLNEAQAHLAEARADAAKPVIDKQNDTPPSPADAKKETPLASAQHELDEEAQKASRLFVIDAGLDTTALRARYPNRQRYALVRGLVQQLIQYDENEEMVVFGSIGQIFTAEIHIPHEFESAAKAEHFTAQVAFGKKLEPWVVTVKTVP